jgi:hypothetical protein
MAYLDFKITSWKRVYVPDEKVQETIEKLKSGDCDAPYDLLEDDEYYFSPGGADEECEEPMLPDENAGASTQELYNSDGEILYKNGI